jgi:hypothetical protein
MLLPAMDHLPGGDRVRLLVVTDGSRLDVCLPVVPVRRWRRRVPVPALVSWTHDFQVLGTPIVDSRRSAQALSVLLRAGRGDRRGAALLEIEDLGDGGPVAAALDEAAAAVGGSVRRWEGYERAVLTRTADGAVVGDERRERRRRARRALERVVGPLTSVDRADDPEAVERFLELEAAGWKGRAGTAIACDPAAAAFFREICRRFAAAGRLELRSFEARSGPVATEMSVHAGGGAFHLKTAHDEQYRVHSPGVLSMVDIADRFAAEPLDFRDACTGGSGVMEGRVWPGRRRISTVVMPFASPVSRAVVAGLCAARGRRSAGRSGSTAGDSPDGAAAIPAGTPPA